MNTRQTLMEQYEDALFAVIMNEIMLEEGRELLEESARLKADPSFAVPGQTDRRCLKTIARAFGKRKRAHAARTAWRVFQKVSVAAFAAMLLFTGVYAAFPSVRAATLNLLIEVSDVATVMRFREDEVQENLPDGTAEARIYELGELPDGFVLTDAGDSGLSYWRIYSNNSGAKIMLDVMDGSGNMAYKFDTEDVYSIEDIEVNGATGMMVEKDNQIITALADNEHKIFINITCYGLSKEDAINVVFGLTFTEQNF